jgi:hypothetical protein
MFSEKYYTYIDASDTSEDHTVLMGIGEKNPDFMKPDPPTPVNPDDPDDPSNPDQPHENTFLIAIISAILLVTCLICAILFKRKRKHDLSRPVDFGQYQDFGDVKSNKKQGLIVTRASHSPNEPENINES